jgi:hypothetical protein
MIHFLQAEDWNPNWEKGEDGRVFIDLRHQHTEEEIVRTIGNALKGSDSLPVTGKRLDAMEEVVGDWLYEHWGPEKKITIAGGSSIEKLGTLFAMNLVASIYDASLSAIYNRAMNQEDGIDQEINNIHIYIVMN